MSDEHHSGDLPHLDERGAARMVDIGAKPATHRIAVAEAFVRMQPETVELLASGAIEKGDALAVARIAGIQASKRTADLVPLAHPIALTHVAVDLSLEPELGGVQIETRAETVAATGVELEALTAAMAAALSIYDMAKARDRGMVIEGVRLRMKSGGRSGTFTREYPGETEPDGRAEAQAASEARALRRENETTDEAAARSPEAAAARPGADSRAPTPRPGTLDRESTDHGA
jgi:cyclic pyranopterin phosphate synthase